MRLTENRAIISFSYGNTLKDLDELLATKLEDITVEKAKAFIDYQALQGRKARFFFDNRSKCVGLLWLKQAKK